MKPRVLVVDDEPAMRFTLREILEGAGYAVDDAVDGVAALERLAVDERYDLVITDLRMPRMDGLELLARLREGLAPHVIVSTAHGSERHAVEAIKRGALDYFRKPFENDELLAVVARAVAAARLRAENERLQSELNLSRSLVFASEVMSQLALRVQRVAPRDVTVLITGESGTGKERVAEAIVRASPRAGRAYVRFNCAALTPELAEAELFGHARGAFTGAHRARPGLFREAHGGTLLLDEVGELDALNQARLLRVLQEREVRPVGEERAQRIDVRILAATHRDLAQLVAEGRFREDLYYRLKVVELRVPPLRERRDDIPVLAELFLRRFAERFGLGELAATDALRARLLAWPWPGNVRELENALEALVAMSGEGELDLALLPGAAGAGGEGAVAASEGDAARVGLKQRVDAYERGLIVQALAAARGNRSHAARALGISRATLHEKLRKYGLTEGGDEGAV